MFGRDTQFEDLKKVIGSGLIALGGVPREQKMLEGHQPRVICNQVY